MSLKITVKSDGTTQATVAVVDGEVLMPEHGPFPLDQMRFVLDARDRTTTYYIMLTVAGPLLTVHKIEYKGDRP